MRSVTLLMLAALAAPAGADVCRWTDAAGVIHFSQRCDPNTPAQRRWHGGTRTFREGSGEQGGQKSLRPALTERSVVRAPINPPAPTATP